MHKNHFTPKYLYMAFLLCSISLQASIIDSFIEKLDYKPIPKQYKKHQSHHTPSEEAQWQISLQFLGYYTGRINGDLYTQKSFDAITKFHIVHQEVTTGFLEEEDKRYLSEVYHTIALSHYLAYKGNDKKKIQKRLQAALTIESLYKGKIDGYFGEKSKHAFLLYKSRFDKNRSNIADPDIKKSLINNARQKIKKHLETVKEDHFEPQEYADNPEKKDLLYSDGL